MSSIYTVGEQAEARFSKRWQEVDSYNQAKRYAVQNKEAGERWDGFLYLHAERKVSSMSQTLRRMKHPVPTPGCDYDAGQVGLSTRAYECILDSSASSDQDLDRREVCA